MRILSSQLRKSLALFTVLLVTATAAHGATNNSAVWHFKREFLSELTQPVPKLLRSQNLTNGHFGSGVWIPADQNVIFALAAAWSMENSKNPYYHDPKLLEAIIRGGDALIEAQDKTGQWMFRKKDNSTWGMHYDPWVYSRWVRTYSLIQNAMPPERRARWQQALELGFSGIAKRELKHVHNIPTHHAMALYIAGRSLNRPEWCTQASAFLKQVAEQQDPGGFWSEHLGPLITYDLVYLDALGTYYSLSHDTNVLAAVQRAARFHANFTYPDGSNIETIDERTPYSKRYALPNPGFTFSAEGRGYLHQQWMRLKEQGSTASYDSLASLLLYGEEGPEASAPVVESDSTFVTGDGKAAVLRKGPWCACFSAYTGPLSNSRWIQDRQNLVSLFHEQTGLFLGGGNTKLQPLWSTFTVGETSLLQHRPGDEKPSFAQPANLLHVPTKAAWEQHGQSLQLEYGDTLCSVTLDLSGKDTARLTYTAKSGTNLAPVAAHLPFLPTMGKPWRTASGKQGKLSATPFKLTAQEAGGWFEHNGWRMELPPGSSLTWPVLPHNPYRKDGHAEPAEGRIVLSLPFTGKVTTQQVVLTVGN